MRQLGSRQLSKGLQFKPGFSGPGNLISQRTPGSPPSEVLLTGGLAMMEQAESLLLLGTKSQPFFPFLGNLLLYSLIHLPTHYARCFLFDSLENSLH